MIIDSITRGGLYSKWLMHCNFELNDHMGCVGAIKITLETSLYRDGYIYNVFLAEMMYPGWQLDMYIDDVWE